MRVKRADLQKALAICKGFIAKRSTMEFSDKVLLSVIDDTLTLRATNLEQSCEVVIPLSGGVEFESCGVNLESLEHLARSGTAEELELERGDSRIFIKCGHRARLAYLPGKLFPATMEPPDFVDTLMLAPFAHSIALAAKAADAEDRTGPNAHVCVVLGEQAEAIGFNQKQVASVKWSALSEAAAEIMVHPVLVKALGKLGHDETEEVEILSSDRATGFRCGNVTICSVLPSRGYPDFPKNGLKSDMFAHAATTCVLSCVDLLKAFESADPFSWTDYGGKKVFVSIAPGRPLTVSAGKENNVAIDVPCSATGEAVSFEVNPLRATGFLAAVDEETITIKCSGKNGTLEVTPTQGSLTFEWRHIFQPIWDGNIRQQPEAPDV